MSEEMKRPTYDEMVDNAVKQIIRAFGKGSDLHGACATIVNSSANWGAENVRNKEKNK